MFSSTIKLFGIFCALFMGYMLLSAIKNIEEKFYFSFNHIDHYSIEISEEDIYEKIGKDELSPDEELFERIISLAYPIDMSDTMFLDSIERIGYTKTTIDAEKHIQISEIFKEKKHEEVYAYACIAEYRDILVFRYNGVIKGLAKVCFSCDQSYIIGTTANTEEFGMSGDYGRLARILYE